MLNHPKQVVVKYKSGLQENTRADANAKSSMLLAYTGIVPLIARMCLAGNGKKRVVSWEEKSQEMWKKEFFHPQPKH